jgi:hypothetical protein
VSTPTNFCVGRAVAQLFAPRADAILRFVLLAVGGIVTAVLLALGAVASSQYFTGDGTIAPQPVPFSHQHHAGELGIDCRYCHTTVQVAANAGMPPTYTCMTCHSQIWTGAPMLAPVRQSLAADQPLDWVRVNRLPSYVYFDHSIHIAKGIGCSSCHGRIDRMQLTYPTQGFNMSFCLNCHSAPQHFVRPKSEIFNMAWQPPADQDRIGRALVKQYHIDQRAGRLTDCSICHR